MTEPELGLADSQGTTEERFGIRELSTDVVQRCQVVDALDDSMIVGTERSLANGERVAEERFGARIVALPVAELAEAAKAGGEVQSVAAHRLRLANGGDERLLGARYVALAEVRAPRLVMAGPPHLDRIGHPEALS